MNEQEVGVTEVEMVDDRWNSRKATDVVCRSMTSDGTEVTQRHRSKQMRVDFLRCHDDVWMRRAQQISAYNLVRNERS